MLGEYERVTENGVTRELYYTGGNAILVKTDGISTLYYVHPDHLGSFAVITDVMGNIVQKCTYDAWGNRQFVVKDPALVFDRGYTGHEHLDEFGLINMNGRMYDPLVGRFLSPDPFVQAPDYSQSFNRYSYCLNNPLIYTDPTGEVFGIDDALFIAAMIYIGGLQSNFMYAANNGGSPFNPGNWNWKNPMTYISMAASGFSAYAQTLEHCEYFIDVVNKSNKPFLYSHEGNGLYNIMHKGTWVDNKTAFRVFETIVKDVALGGVDNIQRVATVVNEGNALFNWFRNLNAFFERGGSGGTQPSGTMMYWKYGGVFTTRYSPTEGFDMMDIGWIFDVKVPGRLSPGNINAAEGLDNIREILQTNKGVVKMVETPKPDSSFLNYERWSSEKWGNQIFTTKDYGKRWFQNKDTANLKKKGYTFY